MLNSIFTTFSKILSSIYGIILKTWSYFLSAVLLGLVFIFACDLRVMAHEQLNNILKIAPVQYVIEGVKKLSGVDINKQKKQ